jgi:trimethylamine:corrinoid methyltransferase-like protein
MWAREGALDARTRARQIAREILAAQEKPYISPNIDQKIRDKFDILL